MSVTPQFIGQRYKDTSTGNLWIANSLTAGDWTLEYGPPLATTTASNLYQRLGLFTFGDMPGLTKIVVNQSISDGGYDFESIVALTEVDFPNLTAVDPLGLTFGAINIIDCNVMTTVSIPVLVNAGVNGMAIHNNTLLTSIDLSSWVPTNGTTNSFRANNLNAACVNALLARCVANAGFNSGIIRLEAGTNEAPTGQGILDKATLNARHAGLAVTN